MAKKIKINYRKLCQEHYGYTKEQMIGMDVHHVDGNRDNNHPSNLKLITPKQHSELHNDEFVLWARKGSKLGNEAFIKRLREKGPTEKELAHREKMAILRKKGLHRVSHSEDSKKLIGEKTKERFKDKTKHPLWGKTTYQVTSPQEEIYVVSGGWKQWCIDRGLNASNLLKVAKGERKHCKGWKAKIIDD